MLKPQNFHFWPLTKPSTLCVCVSTSAYSLLLFYSLTKKHGPVLLFEESLWVMHVSLCMWGSLTLRRGQCSVNTCWLGFIDIWDGMCLPHPHTDNPVTSCLAVWLMSCLSSAHSHLLKMIHQWVPLLFCNLSYLSTTRDHKISFCWLTVWRLTLCAPLRIE